MNTFNNKRVKVYQLETESGHYKSYSLDLSTHSIVPVVYTFGGGGARQSFIYDIRGGTTSAVQLKQMTLCVGRKLN